MKLAIRVPFLWVQAIKEAPVIANRFSPDCDVVVDDRSAKHIISLAQEWIGGETGSTWHLPVSIIILYNFPSFYIFWKKKSFLASGRRDASQGYHLTQGPSLILRVSNVLEREKSCRLYHAESSVNQSPIHEMWNGQQQQQLEKLEHWEI